MALSAMTVECDLFIYLFIYLYNPNSLLHQVMCCKMLNKLK